MANVSTENRVLPPFKKAAFENQSKEPISEATPSDDQAFFGLAHNQAHPVGFKVMFAAGNVSAFYYHDIVSPVNFDGAGIIEINTAALSIKITGKNLKELFDHVFEARIAWLKEPDSSFVQIGEGQAEIESIKVEKKQT